MTRNERNPLHNGDRSGDRSDDRFGGTSRERTRSASMKKGGQVRIIGGRWKSRRLRLAATAGLRPSPDAVRETLFNWLPHRLCDKSCLDLFAGSGAFGFEAASRGASAVTMVESNPKAVGLLRVNRDALRAENQVAIFAGTAEAFLQRHDGGDDGGGAYRFDIVFLDPPFDDDNRLIGATCENLRARGLLNPDALVYIESPRTDCPLPIPSEWHIIRQKRRGMVQSTLVQI